jgi:hypothetical protein
MCIGCLTVWKLSGRTQLTLISSQFHSIVYFSNSIFYRSKLSVLDLIGNDLIIADQNSLVIMNSILFKSNRHSYQSLFQKS